MLQPSLPLLKPSASSPVLWQSGVRFRAYPDASLAKTLAQWIGCQRFIYNAKVSEDRLFAAQRRMELASTPSASVNTPLDQAYAQFKDKQLSPWLYDVPSQVLRNGAVPGTEGKRRQLKNLAKAPTFRNKGNFDSVLVTSELFRFKKVVEKATGEVRRVLELGTEKNPGGVLDFKAHTDFGMPKQLVIRRTGRHWYVSFSFEHAAPKDFVQRSSQELAYELNLLDDTALDSATLGVDRNVKDNFIAASDGRFFKLSNVQEDRILRKAVGAHRYQRKLARQVKGSANRAKTIKRISAKHEYSRHVRQDFSHQTSHRLVHGSTTEGAFAPRLIVLEDLKVANLVKAPAPKPSAKEGRWLKNGAAAKAALSTKILGACWGSIAIQTAYKSVRASTLVLKVPAHYSSQECSRCGHIHPDNRQEQRFVCVRCKRVAHADTNAAETLKGRGIRIVRTGAVTNKVSKRVAFKTRHSIGLERSGVPAESK
jgi:putative transposase